jgi:hypothetical protein
LNDLLNKNAFHWTPIVEQDFTELKTTMCTTTVLASIDFNKTFLEESDSSGMSIGAVLTQDGQRLEFTSQVLSGHSIG